MGNIQNYYCMIILIGGLILNISGLPVNTENDGDDMTANTMEDLNSTIPNDLYVIRAVVYEIGILTNASSSEEDDSSDSSEEIDLSFFHQHHNGSVIDLSNIPIPIQTNISGQVITGIAPVSFGQLAVNNSNINSSVPITIPKAIVSVVSNYSTQNPDSQKKIISNLEPLLALTSNSSTFV